MGMFLMNNPQEIMVLADFVSILEQLGIAYTVGGSLASSVYGAVRFTQDADLTVEPFENNAQKLLQLLKPGYYVSKDAVSNALRQRSSFNVIHFETAFKIDVFVRKDTAFEKQLLTRRKLLKLSDSLEKSFSIVSPEDIILLKMLWYRDSNCSSERQWADVIGVLKVQAGKLDLRYLKEWAGILGVSELLEKALSEAG
jgi:hypothetical protein